MFLADPLSRAYFRSFTQDEADFETINMMNYLPISEKRLLQILCEMEKDESLQVLKTVIIQGWLKTRMLCYQSSHHVSTC